MHKITFCQMTQNRFHETKTCVERYLPYVDRVILVDGGSTDDSIFYFRNWAANEPKIEFYLYPWCDNFSHQRNNYLSKVEADSWVLVSDPDEWFEDATLEAMQNLITEAESKGKNMIGFQCRSVTLKGEARVWENLDNYHKRLLFKKAAGTHYVGNPHESLAGHTQQIMDTGYVYEHLKQEGITWHRGARNLFCGGGGPNLGTRNKEWVELREITDSLGITNWHGFDKYLLEGKIDERLRAWIIRQYDKTGFDGASEHREVYKLYFRVYHPEEEPEELRGVHIE